MEALIILIISIILLISLGIILYLSHLKNQKLMFSLAKLQSTENFLNTELERLRISNEKLSQEKLISEKDLAKSLEKIDSLNEKLLKDQEADALIKEQLKADFKAISSKIFENLQEKISTNNITQLDSLLKPFNGDLNKLRTRLEDFNLSTQTRQNSLSEQIDRLANTSLKVGQDADKLSKALNTNNKYSGDWGESILSKILENSGLKKDIHYTTQGGFWVEDDSSKKLLLKPDVIINLPENRCLIIDSKLSLLDYQNYCNAQNNDEEKTSLDNFKASIKRHIDSLAKKHYELIKEIPNPDFVLLFMPIEGSYSLLMSKPDNIVEQAYQKKIIILGPSTIMGMLKLIEYLWKEQNQQENSIEIADLGGKLYDRVRLFLDKFESVGVNIDRLSRDYQEAQKTLTTGTRNVVKTALRLEELGVKVKTKISEKFKIKEDEE